MVDDKREQVTKRVDFVAKDDDQQVAAGIVMVPNRVDHHGDFETPDTIQNFATQFEALESAGEADGGVMHAVWPDSHIELESNQIADADTSIGGQDVPEGAWVQEWHFADDELWSLVDDGVLGGYSIGAVDVKWDGPHEQGDLPDGVDVPDSVDLDEEGQVWELTGGIIREVSAVDVPAVPDAQILETKAEAQKRLADHLGNQDAFIEEAMERGHSEADAQALWAYLQRATSVDGSSDPGQKSMFARIGRAAVKAFTGSDDEAPDAKASEAPEGAAEKEGRTLSRQNRESLYATIDASLDVLQDAGVDHGMTRFSDRDDTSFHLDNHQARTWQTPDDEDEEEDGAGVDVSITDNAADGDTSDAVANSDSDMTDDDTNSEAPEWAQELKEQIDEQSERIDAALEDEEKGDGPFDDAPEWAQELKAQVDKQADRVDEISKQTGATESQQLAGSEKSSAEEDGLEERQKFFIPESRR